jgi:hypothetical protein
LVRQRSRRGYRQASVSFWSWSEGEPDPSTHFPLGGFPEFPQALRRGISEFGKNDSNGDYNMDHNHETRGNGGFFSSAVNIALIGFLAIGGYFLITEHRAHVATVIPYLPFLLILACPLLHIFGHGGHEGSGNSRDGSPDEGRNTPPHQH